MNYTANVTREGDEWLATVAGLPGAHTFARNLIALRIAVVEVIRLIENLDDDAIVGVDFHFSGLDREVAAAVELAARRDELDRRRALLTAETARRVSALRTAGYSVRDTAALLGLTPGRVSQITRGLLRRA